ncbi:UDP-N-acetylmuramoyl-tripeptide--D-alanyl-D-alanine ligase [Mangrovimonas spongiae]|uniref:UDP-N-acetylmuramoyl-tripeptide--D-alanyl-D-alanine ligase n=1 Tax=Mangrovimonas spongiae TaxID=2494697 RepID=A0A3R9MHI2_9FLAO|nr:UDP-N-acetylmuramoyl-tripeptide--D-alanyl-D-alanine ligase [Mangrovimonas spongiae]RSK40650.1 UDP-N-acetylmuramoyl-tripeptide--D-alanyl-D-alanine ligase [Mangrovimonas spongiae]
MTINALYKLFLECSAVSTDTRKINPGDLFFALKGDNFNGNTFANKALELGAKYVVIDEKEFKTSNNHILVEDCLKALQDLATHHRKILKTPIIALTGSNGKTTTKELIKAVLSKKYRVSATKGNLNNHIGVPLTLLDIKPDTDIAIVEMGANHHKEIAFLCDIALPDFGLITNFGKAHLEGFGSLEGVVKAKSELYDHLKKHSKTIFFNEDDKTQVKQIGNYNKVIAFGANSKDTKISFVASEPFVALEYMSERINSHLIGHYNFNNIAVAIAIGKYFEVPHLNIKQAIEGYVSSNNRSQIIKTESNQILLDAYNANPTSMMAALENFTNLSYKNKTLILGDMFELGDNALNEHQHIVSFLEKQNDITAIVVGEHFSKTKTSSAKILALKTYADLANYLEKSPLKNRFILIKGSRGMALERALNIL